MHSRTASRRRSLLAPAGALAVATVMLAGPHAPGRDAQAAIAKKSGTSLSIVKRHFRMTRPNQRTRLTVGCPGRTLPLGGGMTADPPPGPDGEGIYPHSYERLGAQRGWQVTPVFFDSGRGRTTPRRVTMQVICSRMKRHVTAPRRSVYVAPGETRQAVATCPGRRQLFAGGFQRTNFTSHGGDFVVESRAITSSSWRVVGRAFGAFGGQLTAIAYCWRSRTPLIEEVSGSAGVPTRSSAIAFTPRCPPGRRMTSGGFSTNGSTSMFLTDSVLHLPGVWSARGYNFGPPATVSAYGYCLRG